MASLNTSTVVARNVRWLSLVRLGLKRLIVDKWLTSLNTSCYVRSYVRRIPCLDVLHLLNLLLLQHLIVSLRASLNCKRLMWNGSRNVLISARLVNL